MVILRQQMRSKPERTDDVLAALAAIMPDARATQGVISLDIARDLLDPDSFVATGIYEDGAALRRQQSALAVHRAMAMFRRRSRRRPIDAVSRIGESGDWCQRSWLKSCDGGG